MTEQQIIETLATKVMGWTKYEIELDMADGGKQKFFDSWQMNGQDIAFQWDPLKNMSDAWMIVEKFRNKKDPIMRAEFALRLPVLIYEIKPRDICLAAYKLVA